MRISYYTDVIHKGRINGKHYEHETLEEAEAIARRAIAEGKAVSITRRTDYDNGQDSHRPIYQKNMHITGFQKKYGKKKHMREVIKDFGRLHSKKVTPKQSGLPFNFNIPSFGRY